jgi:hypothetical protein
MKVSSRSLAAISLLSIAFCLVSAANAGTPMKPDQVNTAGWDKAWTNLVNDAEQSFTPSVPTLLAVEVELVVANPGAAEDELTLTILDGRGQTMASMKQAVRASDCEHTLFVFPDGGVAVKPGESYRIKLAGGTRFGWKYVVGGYQKGAATLKRNPLLPTARSTFLFQTFGPE